MPHPESVRSGWRRELGEILQIAGPLAGAQLAYMLMGVTDSVMMGRISTDSLAAGGVGASFAFMMIYLAMGLLQAIQPVVAQGRGAGDHSGFTRILAAGLVTALICAVPILAVLLGVERIFLAIGEPPVIAHLSWIYVTAFAWAVPAWLCNTALRNYLVALGRTRVIMFTSGTGCLANLVLNWALIFGHLGLPALGLAGSGYATSIVGWSMTMALFAYAIICRLLPHGMLRLTARELGTGLREIWWLGLPIAAMWSVETLLFSGSSLLMGRFGPVALAAHQICINLCSLTYMVPFAISSAATVRVGFQVGADEPRLARIAGFSALALGVSFMAAAAVAICLFSRPIFRLYLDVDDPSFAEVEAIGIKLLLLAALFEVFDGTQVVAAGALRGLRDVRLPLIAGIIGYWVLGFPIGAGLAFGAGLGPVGLWWGFAAGLIVTAFLLSTRFVRLSAQMQRVGCGEFREATESC